MQGPCTWVWHNWEMVNIFRTNRLLLLLHTTSDRIPKACSTNTASCLSHLGRYMISSHTTSLFVLTKVCHGFTSFLFLSLLSFLLLAVQKSGKNLVSFTWAWCDQEMIKNFRTNRLLPLVHTTSNRRLWEGLRMRFGCILSYPSLSSDKLSDIWPHYPPELI